MKPRSKSAKSRQSEINKSAREFVSCASGLVAKPLVLAIVLIGHDDSTEGCQLTDPCRLHLEGIPTCETMLLRWHPPNQMFSKCLCTYLTATEEGHFLPLINLVTVAIGMKKYTQTTTKEN